MRFTLLTALLIPLSTLASASDTLRLTLDDCLKLALTQGRELQSARLDSLASESRWRESKAGLWPQVRLGMDIPSLQESLDETYVFNTETEEEELQRYRYHDLRWQTGFTLTQEMPWGGVVDLSSRLYRREWKGTLLRGEESFTEYSLLRRASYNQPLLAGNPVRREYKIARSLWQAALANYEINRRQAVYQTTSAFYSLALAKGALEIAEQDLQQGRESETLAQRKLAAGLIPEVELLQIQVDVARREGSLRQEQSDFEAAVDQIRVELGLPLEQPLEVVYSDSFNSDSVLELQLNEGERPELTRARMNLERTRLESKASVRATRISASAQVYYELDSREEKLEALSQKGDQNIGVNVRVDVPLWGFGTTSAKIQALKINQRRQELELANLTADLAVDLRDARRRWELARERIKIAEAALRLSEKSHQITSERFDNGLVNSRELIDSQLERTRTRREALNAQVDFALAKAYIDKIAPWK